MKTLGRVTCLVGLLAIASVTACGSDSDDGDGDSFGSGVDQNKSGEDLTTDEIEAICEAGAEYAEDKLTSNSTRLAVCRFAGVVAALSVPGDEASMQEMCETVYEACTDCIDDPGAEGCENYDPGTQVPETECGDEEVPDDCSSTVGEIEACFKATIDQSLTIFTDMPSCDEINDDTEPPDFEEEPESPAACETVEENCPEALE